MSNQDASSSTPKQVPGPAIGSLAKKQADVTRQGTQKLKFVPTLPARRKKETEVKPEPAAPTLPPRGRGRGRGTDGGRGRGAPRPPVEMTASGPFAMGPTAQTGSSARRPVFAPVAVPGRTAAPSGPTAGAGVRAPTLQDAHRKLKKENELGVKDDAKGKDEDEEVYSDPDEGVEIVDMVDVRGMDWMAPESLVKERKGKVKNEVKEEPGAGEVDMANALDLSESEEEEEMEDLIEDFAMRAEVAMSDQITPHDADRIYLFQFPSPFPTFVSSAPAPAPAPPAPAPAPPAPTPAPALPSILKKGVTFALDPSSSTPAPPEPAKPTPEPAPAPLTGRIGHLLIYRSGAVKISLGSPAPPALSPPTPTPPDGILLDVHPATTPSFLTHAAHLDAARGRLTVLGAVEKRFVVSPDVDALLGSLEAQERAVREGAAALKEGLIPMEE